MIFVLIAVLFVSIQCTNVEYVVVPEEPYEFEQVPAPQRHSFDLSDGERELYEKYIDYMYNVINFYSSQIDDYNKQFWREDE